MCCMVIDGQYPWSSGKNLEENNENFIHQLMGVFLPHILWTVDPKN
jgi:hypothetical protein